MEDPGSGRDSSNDWVLTTGGSRTSAGKNGSPMLILMYHRVADVSDPWSTCVGTTHFAEHLEILKRRARPVGLNRFGAALATGREIEGSVILTFDDGYADVLENALPLLERYDIPATLFVTSGQVGSTREFWWDELERVFLRPGRLPDELHISLQGRSHRWSLGEAATYSERDCEQERDWKVWEPCPGKRHSILLAVWTLLRPLAEPERERALEEVAKWAGTGREARETHRAVTRTELATVAGHRLLDIGAHSVTHSHLPGLPPAEQRREIRTSKLSLETILGRPVETFAYPFGDATDAAVAAVREAGFCCACSGAGRDDAPLDRFRLPRRGVDDWSGEEFARHFEAYLRT